MNVQNLSLGTTQNIQNNHSKRNEQVEQMQTEFLLQISEGKEAKDAFFEAIKSATDKNTLPKDEVMFSTSGNRETACKVTPDNAKQWLEVIAIAGPMIKSVIDWALHLFDKNQNQDTECQNQ